MGKTRNKGNKAVRRASEYLKEKGYLVAVIERGGKFIKEKDAYGLFDLSAIKENETVFVQVTCNRPHRHSDYDDFAGRFQGPNLNFLQMVWFDRVGWKLFWYMKNEKYKVEDLRKNDRRKK